jgi:hypothetical protein
MLSLLVQRTVTLLTSLQSQLDTLRLIFSSHIMSKASSADGQTRLVRTVHVRYSPGSPADAGVSQTDEWLPTCASRNNGGKTVRTHTANNGKLPAHKLLTSPEFLRASRKTVVQPPLALTRRRPTAGPKLPDKHCPNRG